MLWLNQRTIKVLRKRVGLLLLCASYQFTASQLLFTARSAKTDLGPFNIFYLLASMMFNFIRRRCWKDAVGSKSCVFWFWCSPSAGSYSTCSFSYSTTVSVVECLQLGQQPVNGFPWIDSVFSAAPLAWHPNHFSATVGHRWVLSNKVWIKIWISALGEVWGTLGVAITPYNLLFLYSIEFCSLLISQSITAPTPSCS